MTTAVPGGRAAARPGRVLLGFALLLVLLFAASFAVGRWVGPPSPPPAGPARGPMGDDMSGMRMAGLSAPQSGPGTAAVPR
ncbi:hypothetical protein [Kitasatospora sp. NBC_01302]|uniref:hypothetical protein n=1 Tax=Kitasatospora sp. NBC_01302 TaxID=2903575 RepID=UPI002E13E92F|nr:hypothetical protein OG294_04795 [Kitasatospora sp. NBC_01302]